VCSSDLNYDKDGNPYKDGAVKDGFWDTSPDGIRRPLQFTMLVNRDQNNMLRNDAAVLMKSQLEKAGITVELKLESWSDYSLMVKQKNFDLALCGCYLSPVPDYSFLVGTGGSLNVGGYSNAGIDTLLGEVQTETDANSLKAKMGELQAAIIDELPVISLYFRTHSLLTTPDIMGVSGVREESAFSQISQWYIGS
jgi:peptide/nickel transport system substrate-binding protein